jgi:hypothetical protein
MNAFLAFEKSISLYCSSHSKFIAQFLERPISSLANAQGAALQNVRVCKSTTPTTARARHFGIAAG